MTDRVALITGVTGQDGAVLAELLLGKGYIVHGVKRRSSSFNTARVDPLYHDPHEEDVRLFLHYGDMTDATNLIRIIQEVQPTEIYNLAALNLDAKRDWGSARDYVDGMWRMLQQPEPDDYVLATGETHSVREFVELAFAEIGRTIRWQGKARQEKGLDTKTGEVLVEIDPRYFRPTEVDFLLGDPTKARTKLGWQHRTTFKELVREMVAADLVQVEREYRRYDRPD
jgi:GDP-D-mannose dehydratase